MNNSIDMKDFWKIINMFPDIRTLSDLTGLITNMEADITEAFPNAYWFLKEYENSMRSHIYAEWHAQEYLDDADTT
jgi:hypothetical protein